MDPSTRRPATPPPLARTGWSPQAIASFGVILAGLTTVGVVGLTHRGAPPPGLPDDPAVNAARAALGGPLVVDAGGLRFESSLGSWGGGGELDSRRGTTADTLAAGAGTAPPDRGARLALAAERLAEARARHPLDPRLDCLLGHVELAAQRLERAERRYRAALRFAPHYGEARLGLGVTLARRAEIEGDEREARTLALEAIAQLAAVEERDRFHLAALHDRAVVTARVGRHAEARRLAERYAELDPASAWSESLRRSLAR